MTDYAPTPQHLSKTRIGQMLIEATRLIGQVPAQDAERFRAVMLPVRARLARLTWAIAEDEAATAEAALAELRRLCDAAVQATRGQRDGEREVGRGCNGRRHDGGGTGGQRDVSAGPAAGRDDDA